MNFQKNVRVVFILKLLASTWVEMEIIFAIENSFADLRRRKRLDQKGGRKQKMGDIVIRGMEKPKSCIGCKYLREEDNFCPVADTHLRSDQIMNRSCCPFEELPSHGRLIDADVARNEIGKLFCEKCKSKNDSDKCWTCRVHSCIRIIDDEPTILEATE